MPRIRRPAFKPALVLIGLLIAAGCGGDRPARDAAEPSSTTDATAAAGLIDRDDLGPPHLLAFACGEDAPYLALHDPDTDTITLLTMTETRVLAHQVAASGARYGDDRYTLWTKGHDQILLEIDGQAVADCEPSGRQRVLAAAWQAGYVLRATGNEPFWALLISDESIRLDLLGRPAVAFTGLDPAELTDGTGEVARRTSAHDLRLLIEAAPCRDTMSGEPSPHAVTVHLDGEVLRGCGLWLRPRAAGF